MENKSSGFVVLPDQKLFQLFRGLGDEYVFKGLPFLPEDQKVEELMRVLKDQYHRNQLSDAKITAGLMTESQLLDKIPKLIGEYIQDCFPFNREFGNARHMANLLPEIQRKSALRRILAKSVEKDDLESIVETKKLLKQQLRLKDVIRFFDGPWDSDSQYHANYLPESLLTKVLRAILPRYIDEGSLDYALEVAKLLGRDLTSRELEIFRVKSVKAGSLEASQKIALLLNRPLDTKELLMLFSVQYKATPFYYHLVFEIINLLPGPQRIQKLNKLLKRSIEEGSLYGFQDTLKYLGRRATNNEMIAISSTYSLEDSVLSRVLEFAHQLPEPNRTFELTHVLKFCCEQRPDLYYARCAAEQLGRDLTLAELECILLKHKEAGSHHDVFRVVKIMPEPRRTNELIMLLELCQKPQDKPTPRAKEVAEYLLQIM